MRRAQHASPCTPDARHFQNRVHQCVGASHGTTQRIFRRHSHHFHHSATPCGHRFPTTCVERLAPNPIRHHTQLQRYCPKHRQRKSHQSRGASHRSKRHQHLHPMPPRDRHQPLPHRLRRRPPHQTRPPLPRKQKEKSENLMLTKKGNNKTPRCALFKFYHICQLKKIIIRPNFKFLWISDKRQYIGLNLINVGRGKTLF